MFGNIPTTGCFQPADVEAWMVSASLFLPETLMKRYRAAAIGAGIGVGVFFGQNGPKLLFFWSCCQGRTTKLKDDENRALSFVVIKDERQKRQNLR